MADLICHTGRMNAPRKRLKAAESRRALLDAGIQLLHERGVAPGLDRVTLKEAIEISGVPRSTAYRLYEGGRGQLGEFRADLLSDLKVTDVQPSMDDFGEVLRELRPLIDSQDPIQMATALREFVRTITNGNLDAMLSSLSWRVYMSSLAALTDTADMRDQVASGTTGLDGYQFGQSSLGLLEYAAGMFGVRVRAPFTFSDLGASLTAIHEGVALRIPANPRLGSMKRPTGPDGELQTWNVAGCAAEAFLLMWLEPDPSAAVSADLTSWTDRA